MNSPLNGSSRRPWIKVVFLHDCIVCDACGDAVCPTCEDHYADCPCPGPMQEDEYEYKEFKGIEYARLKDD